MRAILELPEESRDDKGDLLANVDRVVADPLDRPCGGCLLCKPYKLPATAKADRRKDKLAALKNERAAW